MNLLSIKPQIISFENFEIVFDKILVEKQEEWDALYFNGTGLNVSYLVHKNGDFYHFHEARSGKTSLLKIEKDIIYHYIENIFKECYDFNRTFFCEITEESKVNCETWLNQKKEDAEKKRKDLRNIIEKHDYSNCNFDIDVFYDLEKNVFTQEYEPEKKVRIFSQKTKKEDANNYLRHFPKEHPLHRIPIPYFFGVLNLNLFDVF